MKVIGIDASTNKTGICVFEDGKYVDHILIDCHTEKDTMKRITMMANHICKYMNQFTDVDLIIMEKSVLKTNIDTVQKLSNLAGIIMFYAYKNKITFQHPTPSEWRKKVGLEQSNKVKRDMLKLEAIKAVRLEYGIDVTDDEAESILMARSGFNLPKLNIKVKDVDDDI